MGRYELFRRDRPLSRGELSAGRNEPFGVIMRLKRQHEKYLSMKSSLVQDQDLKMAIIMRGGTFHEDHRVKMVAKCP